MNYQKIICDAMDEMADGKDEAAEAKLNECMADIKIHTADGSADESHYYNWGMCLYLLEEYEQSLLKFEKVLEFDPAHEDSLWQIVSILFYNLQKAEAALHILEKKLLPKYPDEPLYNEALTDIQSYLRHAPKEASGEKPDTNKKSDV